MTNVGALEILAERAGLEPARPEGPSRFERAAARPNLGLPFRWRTASELNRVLPGCSRCARRLLAVRKVGGGPENRTLQYRVWSPVLSQSSLSPVLVPSACSKCLFLVVALLGVEPRLNGF